jgi:hypothetical protein
MTMGSGIAVASVCALIAFLAWVAPAGIVRLKTGGVR